MRGLVISAVLILLFVNTVSPASENDVFEIETEGRYRLEVGTSNGLAKEMALFPAKRKAVDLAGKYLSHKGLIKVYEKNRDEIYSLAAREIQVKILAQKLETIGETPAWRLWVRARVKASDFITGQILYIDGGVTTW